MFSTPEKAGRPDHGNYGATTGYGPEHLCLRPVKVQCVRAPARLTFTQPTPVNSPQVSPRGGESE